ncbi:hypothetical protein JCM19039_2330 [Geomicrobium sp. JCM 19039]|nr:hypothetical protein JCM19039_2330 [Geomicrobium sp. JCM 19039]
MLWSETTIAKQSTYPFSIYLLMLYNYIMHGLPPLSRFDGVFLLRIVKKKGG